VPELRKAQGAVQRLGTQIDKSNSRMRGFNNGITTMQANTRKFAMGGLQQAGYQIGDYAVQVANGTSKMQAFGQQAPQFLQIFGPIGAIVGAGVAIFSALAVVVQRSKKEVVDSSKAFEGLISQMRRVNDLSTGVVDFSALLEKEFSKSKEEVQGLIDTMIKLEQIEVLKKLSAGFSGITDELAETADTLNSLEGRKKGLQTQLKYLDETDAKYRQITDMVSELDAEIKKVGTSSMDINNIFNQIQSVMRETDPNKLVEGLAKAKADAEAMGGPVGNMIISAITEAAKKADLLGAMEAAARDAAKEAADATADLKDKTDEAAKAGERLAQAMQKAANAVMNINTSAFDKLKSLQAEMRGRTRGLNDDQIRVMQAGMRAEKEAVKLGVDSAAELAAIGAEAMKIERDIIANESGISQFTKTLDTAKSKTSSLAKTVKTELSPEMKRLVQIGDLFGSSFENAAMSAIDGTKSVKDAFRSMASDIIKELYRIFVVKRITNFISNAAMMAFGPAAQGPTPSGAPVGRFDGLRFEGGGYTGNGARAGGLDGKGGRMAMIHPRETVVDHTKGQGMGGVTVIQNNTFGSGVSRAEVNAMLPKMIEATKAAVVDAKRQGGSYGRAFA
ncbi:hypothetical protein, partial [Lentibacter algarum]|uniref:hypothetical protein n=1 Tax=Lentibacter algarum TaxID=576131 RepID=UPI0026F37153